MALSEATVASLREALTAVDEFYARRLEEIDRDVRNLRAYGTSLSALGDQTTEVAVTETTDILTGVGINVT